MKVLKFSASWCQPCKALTAAIAQSKTTIEVEEIDIDKNAYDVKEYKVRGVPTLILVDDADDEVRRHTGPMTAAAFEQFVATSVVDTD